MVNILFIHQNFPGQFKALAPALAQRGHRVVALAMNRAEAVTWQGVRILPWKPARGTTPGVHPWVVDLETKVIRGEAVLEACRVLAAQGFTPDAVVAHPGWGESLFIKTLWPQVRLGLYAEFHYASEGADTGFDPEFPVADPVREAARLRLKNANQLLHADLADAALSPTHWQASTYPEPFRQRITIAHDGIDTDRVRPDPSAQLALATEAGPLTLRAGQSVLTFVNRNLEPYRGYHIFLRALPAVLARHPDLRVVLVGGDAVSYGARPAQGGSWKQVFLAEVGGRLDLARVHFVGQLPYGDFLTLLQVSRVHAYLTYPFVLSWSLLEAMSAGCAIVASDTAPLREVIRDDHNGRLVPFFEVSAWSDTLSALLDDAEVRARFGAAARAEAVARYDLQRVCLPQQVAWVEALAAR